MAKNAYDKNDIVRQVSLIRSGGLKLAAYRLKDLETGEFSKLQFHATWDNTVMAVMGEEAAKLFASFVTMTLEPPNVRTPDADLPSLDDVRGILA